MTDDSLFDMIYDYPFEIGNSFFKTAGHKETVAGRSQKSGLRQGFLRPLESLQVQNKTKHTIDANRDTMP